MAIYIIGLTMLASGAYGLKLMLSAHEPPSVRKFLFVANTLCLGAFLWGFVKFSWYAPLLSLIVLPALVFSALNAIKPKGFSLLYGLRNHILIISGVVAAYTALILF